jgi:hypothetical protein
MSFTTKGVVNNLKKNFGYLLLIKTNFYCLVTI